jgi:hypothetical protein
MSGPKKISLIRRILTRNKTTVQKTSQVDLEVADSLYEKLNSNEKANATPTDDVVHVASSENKTVLAATAISLTVLGAGMSYSPPANAWVADIVKGITEKAGAAVLEPLKGIFGNLMEGFGLSNMFSSQEGAKAQGRSTDAMNEVTSGVEKNKLLRATEPPPHLCLAMAESKHTFKMESAAAERSKQNMTKWVAETSDKAGSGKMSDDFVHRLMVQAERTDNPNLAKLLQMSSLSFTSVDTISDPEMKEAAYNHVDSITIPVIEMVGKPNMNVKGRGAVREVRKLSKHNKINLARSILVEEIEDKVSETAGEASRYETRKLQVKRTFGGGSDWHDEVLLKGDPTPLLKDLMVLTGTSNDLLLEILNESKKSNRVASANLLESIERNLGA